MAEPRGRNLQHQHLEAYGIPRSVIKKNCNNLFLRILASTIKRKVPSKAQMGIPFR